MIAVASGAVPEREGDAASLGSHDTVRLGGQIVATMHLV